MTKPPRSFEGKAGIKKGGARYPRYALSDALTWSRKLVSKTHLSAQPADVIFAAVVGAKGSVGDVKVSALKQYGLLAGDSKGYLASDLGKKINSSPENELKELLRASALKPVVFKSLFETFHGDTVSKAKLRQRASDLNVHPDMVTNCVEIYAESLALAGLVSVSGDEVVHAGVSESLVSDQAVDAQDAEGEAVLEEEIETMEVDPPLQARTQRAVFNVNINLDASMDVDKLARQLELLRKFGAI